MESPPHGSLVITGASRGIGAATAKLAAEKGYAVAVNYRQQRDAADGVVAAIRSLGGRATAIRADVSVEADVERLFLEAEAELGQIVGLVNNAGVLAAQGRVDAMDLSRWQRVFATNVFGTFLCCREAIRRFSTYHGGNGGSIVNVSSVASRLGAAGEYVDYAASKGAVDTFTLGLAREVAKEGIRVNGVRPGIIETEIHASGGDPGRAERLAPSVPQGRPGQPIEVAEAILWLMSDAASFVTGTLLDVSGGR